MALPQPKGKQLEVLDLKPEGHNVVLGTAGSGKTTLAIYRAIYLATLDDKEKVMLVTFNTTLVKYLEAIVGSEIPRNIEVRNYHKFARGYLAHGTFTFFGDVAQQIYGSRLSWREAGLKIAKNKIWYFDRNYRNSKEIAQFAVAISKSKYFEDKQDLVEPVLPTASSPLPAIVKCKDEEAELDWIVEAAIRMSGNQSIAILVRNRELVDLVEEKLRAKKIIPQILKNRMGVLDLNAKISIGTYHSAKGLEFDMVFLPFCSMKYLPSEERVLANESRDEALKEETKLLYVAITRAKRGLILSYTEEKTELLLEVDTSLYDERELK